jgi:hypothetical protein
MPVETIMPQHVDKIPARLNLLYDMMTKPKSDFAKWLETEGICLDNEPYFLAPSSISSYNFSIQRFLSKRPQDVSKQRDLWKYFIANELLIRSKVGDNHTAVSLEEVLQDLRNSTSAGHPYYLPKGVVLSKMASDVFKRLDRLEQEECIESLVTMNPKCEPLPRSKKYIKERIVSTAPLDQLIHTKKWTKSLFDARLEHWNMLPSKIGISTWFGQFAHMYKRMSRFNRHLAIDVKGLETSMTGLIQKMLWKARGIYNPACRRAFDLIARYNTHAKVASLDGRVFESVDRECSGTGSTLFDNTDVTTALVFYLLDVCFGLSPERYGIDFEFAVIGDDILISCNDDVMPNLDNAFAEMARAAEEVGFELSLEGSSDTVYGLPFCGFTVRTEGGLAETVREAKMMAALMYQKNSRSNVDAVTAVSLLIRNGPNGEVLKKYLSHLKSMGVSIPMPDPFTLEMMMGGLKLQAHLNTSLLEYSLLGFSPLYED